MREFTAAYFYNQKGQSENGNSCAVHKQKQPLADCAYTLKGPQLQLLNSYEWQKNSNTKPMLCITCSKTSLTTGCPSLIQTKSQGQTIRCYSCQRSSEMIENLYFGPSKLQLWGHKHSERQGCMIRMFACLMSVATKDVWFRIWPSGHSASARYMCRILCRYAITSTVSCNM